MFETNKENPYSSYIMFLMKKSDEEINALSAKEIAENFVGKATPLDWIDEDLKSILSDKDKVDEFRDILLYAQSKSIEFPISNLNSPIMLNVLAAHLSLISNANEDDLLRETFDFLMKLNEINHTRNGKYKESFNERITLLTKDDIGENLYKILKEAKNYKGFKLLVEHEGEIFLPFWDWTISYLIEILNENFRDDNAKMHGMFWENVFNQFVSQRWAPEFCDSNIEYRVNLQAGEVDFAFVKEGSLHIFEIKNVADFANPKILNNGVFKNWKEQYIDKGVSQLKFIEENAKKIFSDWKFDRVYTYLVTFGRNRFDPMSFPKDSLPNKIVFTDIDNVFTALSFSKGYEMMEVISEHGTSRMTGLYDWIDWAGVLQGWHKDLEILEDFKDYEFDKGVLYDGYEIVADSDNLNTENLNFLGEWNGDYRPFVLHQVRRKQNDSFFPWHDLNKFVNSSKYGFGEKIRTIKIIHGSDYLFINKRTLEISKKQQ